MRRRCQTENSTKLRSLRNEPVSVTGIAGAETIPFSMQPGEFSAMDRDRLRELERVSNTPPAFNITAANKYFTVLLRHYRDLIDDDDEFPVAAIADVDRLIHEGSQWQEGHE